MIRAEGLVLRRAGVRLGPASFELGAGVHAFLGTPEGGVPLLLAALAGRVKPRKGSVRILGHPVAGARTEVAYVPLDATLPDALRVDEALDLAATIRGEPRTYATHRLAVLGLAPLATCLVRRLTPAETRAVAMAEALTSTARVIVFEEPYVCLDPRAAGALASCLRERREMGTCVVLGTASARDAADLAAEVMVVERGALRPQRADEGTGLAHRRPARLRFAVSDVAKVLAALTADPAIRNLETDQASVVVSGSDIPVLAAAVARAVVASGVDLAWLRPDPR